MLQLFLSCFYWWPIQWTYSLSDNLLNKYDDDDDDDDALLKLISTRRHVPGGVNRSLVACDNRQWLGLEPRDFTSDVTLMSCDWAESLNSVASH